MKKISNKKRERETKPTSDDPKFEIKCETLKKKRHRVLYVYFIVATNI